MAFLAKLYLPDVGEPGGFERRRSRRLSLDARGAMLIGRGVREVLICDLSQQGFRAVLDRELAVGNAVRLLLAGPRPVPATVAWRRGTTHGFTFVKPISAVAIADAFSGRAVVGEGAAPPAPFAPPWPLR